MRNLLAVILLIASILSFPASAGVESDALSSCLTDNTNGKDRKELIRWVFIAMSAHPDMSDLTATSDATRIQSNKAMATLISRLLTQDCVVEARLVQNKPGNSSMSDSFKSLGEVAMRELIANRNVTASIGDYLQYVDKQQLMEALRQK